jgi:hypothetical protein
VKKHTHQDKVPVHALFTHKGALIKSTAGNLARDSLAHSVSEMTNNRCAFKERLSRGGS